MSKDRVEDQSAEEMLEILRQYQVETLQEENRRLKEENTELHRQVDVIDVIMSDTEAREIIRSIKVSGSLDYESPAYELETLSLLLQKIERDLDSLNDGEPADDELFKQAEQCARLLENVHLRVNEYAEMLSRITDRL